jgi:alcohol dehydrogenase (NADP+)
MTTPTLSYAAQSASAPLAPFEFNRRANGERDVAIDIHYCGVCHSDLHTAKNEWRNTRYPVVPGHEIIGKVSSVGAQVTKYKVGDTVGVGCMVDSCRTCEACKQGLEQYCEAGFASTYNSAEPQTGQPTRGGYSQRIVVKDEFVLRLPNGLDPAKSAPLLCAGITLYSPLKHWGAGPGKKVGIVGLGGLGHMGLKIAHAMGAETALFTTSPNKKDDAKRLGADHVILSKEASAMRPHRNSFDLIVDTISAPHSLDTYTQLLKRDGTLVLVGAPPEPHPSPSVGNLVFSRRAIAGSLIGGIPETQEMLDFCAKHGLTSDVEMIAMKDINTAYDRMLKSDVKYRFVIDIKGSDFT